jgi:hypothetical protein
LRFLGVALAANRPSASRFIFGVGASATGGVGASTGGGAVSAFLPGSIGASGSTGANLSGQGRVK